MSIHIAQIGTFDLENYGDLLFPDVLEREIERRHLDIEVSLFSPIGGQKPFDCRRYVYPIMELPKVHSTKPIDAIVIGGGDLIRLDDALVSNKEKYQSFSPTVLCWVYPLMFAYLNNIRVVFNNPGVPFSFAQNHRVFVQKLLNSVDYLSVRDETSKAFLDECICKQVVQVAPDTVIMARELFSEEQLEEAYQKVLKDYPKLAEKQYVLFQTNSFDSRLSMQQHGLMMKEIGEVLDMRVVYFPIGYVHSDVELLQDISRQASIPSSMLITQKLTPLEMLSVIKHAGFFIGTSLHGNLTSFVFDVPAVALNFLSLAKMQGFFQWINRPEAITNSLGQVPVLLRQLTQSSYFQASNFDFLVEKAQIHFDRLFEIIQNTQKPKYDNRLIPLLELIPNAQYNASKDGCFYWAENGEGFCEDHRIFFTGIKLWNTLHLHCRLNLPSTQVNRLRFDPVENSSCVIKRLSVTADCGELHVVRSNGIFFDDMWIFDSLDPWLEFAVGYPIKEVYLQAEICLDADKQTMSALLNAFVQTHGNSEQLRSQLNASLKDEGILNEQINGLEIEIKRQAEQISSYIAQNEIAAMEKEELSKQFEIAAMEKEELSKQLDCLMLEVKRQTVQLSDYTALYSIALDEKQAWEYDRRKLETKCSNMEAELSNYKALQLHAWKLQENHNNIQKELNEISTAYNTLLHSKSWRLTKPLRVISHLFRKK